MVVPAPVVDPGGRLFCYALTDEAWVVGGAVSNGGAVARWAGGIFGGEPGSSPIKDSALLELAASVPAGSDGLVMLPYLLAERGPLWDPDLTGAFLGVTHRHTRGHFVRAAVEGVALQLSTIVEALDAVQPVTSVRATGGVFRSQLWRSVVAGVLDRPLQVTAGAEGSALGAAALGLLSLGRAVDLAGAVRLLAPTLEAGEATVAVPAADLVAYQRTRRAVPSLLAGYREVAALFEPSSAPATRTKGSLAAVG
jgi:gluconokinase